MMSGWVTESGEYVESEDDWANGLYYADGEGDGSVVTNAWVYTTVPDDTNEDETEPHLPLLLRLQRQKNCEHQEIHRRQGVLL